MQIIIIDDSPVMRKIICKSLLQSGYADAEYVEVGDGFAALDLLENTNPDLILCDWNMPGMTGLEVLKDIRTKGLTVPFGFVTTEFTDRMRSLAHKNGADFLLSKPFNVAQLKAKLDPILRPLQ